MVDLIQEKEAFDRQGFLGPFRLYDPDEAKAILKEIRAKNNDQSHNVYGTNPVNYDRHFDIAELTRHVGHPEIVKRLRLVLGDDVLCWRTEWFPKFPGSSGTEWHAVRDYSYASGVAQIEPTEETQDSFFDLTAWTTFTEANKETGCMKFLPGSHKRNLFDEHQDVKTGRSLGYNAMGTETQFFGYKFAEFKVDPNWDPDAEEAVALEMQPGECVLFTARCVHGSYPNTSERKTRFAIATRYVPTHVRVYAEQESFMAHGTNHNLKDYGVVLVSGKDEFGHNRTRHINNRGEWFPKMDGLASPAELGEAEIRQQIDRVWRQALKFEGPIPPQDDFFDDLGGHSLLLQEIKPQLEQALRREIPTEALFRHSSLDSLAQYIQGLLAQPESADLAAAASQPLPTVLPEGMSIQRAPVPG